MLCPIQNLLDMSLHHPLHTNKSLIMHFWSEIWFIKKIFLVYSILWKCIILHSQLTEKALPWTDLVWVNWQSSWTPGWEWKSCRCYLFLSVWGAAAGAPDDSPALQKPQNDCIVGSEEHRPTCDSVRTRNKAARSLSAHMTRQTPNEQMDRKSNTFQVFIFVWTITLRVFLTIPTFLVNFH